jgi:hypothetical protein
MTIVRSFAPMALAILAAAAAALAGAPTAQASCAPAPPLDQAIAQANVVFVGTVQSTEHGGLTANFRVEDVWKSGVGATAVVHGGPGIAALEDAARKGLGVATSVDRTYEMGTRYLVVSHGKADGVLLESGQVWSDNICSSTQPYKDDLASFRPAGAHPPAEGGSAVGSTSPPAESGRSPLLWALLAAAVALGTGLTIVLMRSRLRAGRAA